MFFFRPLPHFVTQGKQFGIDFTFKCPRYPNTIRSHALLEFAKDKGDFDKQNEISEKIFQVTNKSHLKNSEI